ncbi:MAG: hypothetical protein WC661_07110 [Opitutaceae bacterium]
MKKLPLILCVFCAAVAASFTPNIRAEATPARPQYDLGDQTSSTLTAKAWKAAESGDLAAVKAYTARCIQLYEATALTQQRALTAPPPTADPAVVHANWALNDVGTCYFILGQALEKANQASDAIKAYKTLVEKLAYSKCWDTKGWFWSPADAARGRVKALAFDAAQ